MLIFGCVLQKNNKYYGDYHQIMVNINIRKKK